MTAQQALDEWNSYAVRNGWPLVRRMTPDRVRKVNALIKGGMDDWREALAKAERSHFLCGQNERGWRLHFDFFISERGFTRTLEGVYDNKDSTTVSPKSPEQLQQEARVRGYRQTGFWLQSWGEKPGEVH